ncbi:hypothetical protein ACT5YR_05630, partial [Fructobacillus fructosus]|uniref:hypothetical protein n=1 Tax=Fructobacillus fructosus TaxID=1631 RepID=UPI00403333CF
AEKQANRISKITNASRVPNFTKSFAGIASVGNTATYMVVFLLPDTRRLIIVSCLHYLTFRLSNTFTSFAMSASFMLVDFVLYWERLL